jgi:hypothetical protein
LNDSISWEILWDLHSGLLLLNYLTCWSYSRENRSVHQSTWILLPSKPVLGVAGTLAVASLDQTQPSLDVSSAITIIAVGSYSSWPKEFDDLP